MITNFKLIQKRHLNYAIFLLQQDLEKLKKFLERKNKIKNKS
jgi:hypothetical protein